MIDFASGWTDDERIKAKEFCEAFLSAPRERRFVFGRNVYAYEVAKHIEIAAYVDDFTSEDSTSGVPIVRTTALPANAYVLAASGGRPLTVKRHLDSHGLRNLDYFAFRKWSGLVLPEAVFNEGFEQEFDDNRAAFMRVYEKLADDESQTIMRKLLSFRKSYNIKYLEGFSNREEDQYFEPFLNLNYGLPVFADVGGYDGQTSEQFIERVPNYEKIYIFEPDPLNLQRCKYNLRDHANVEIYPFGAGNATETLRFSQAGSASAIDPNGEVKIEIRKIDDIISERLTFIKMDIEGAELSALEGARSLIVRYKPDLAICVYHRPADFWRIPELVLTMNPDYKVYLRHYTESIYETVMFFVQGRSLPREC